MTLATEAKATCEECGGRGWVVTDDGGAGSARRCVCQKGKEIPSLLKLAGIPQRYEKCRLRTFRWGHLEEGAGREQLVKAMAECRRYVGTFLTPEGTFRETGLLFIGPPGGGKTHLAVAVLAELIEGYGVRGRFVDFTSLIHEIQSTFDTGSPASKHAILEPIKNAELLVLDELGAQKPTAWVSDVLYLIMNARYSNRRPTLFTTNYQLDEPETDEVVDLTRPSPAVLRQRIPEVLVSRLYEMAKPISMDAVGDYRRQFQKYQHRV